MTDNRLAGADFVRASACILVVVSHVAQRISENILLEPQSTLKFVVMMGNFGVAPFFVLSGYLLSRPFWEALDAGKPMPSLRVYALRRAARILPAFYLSMTIVLLLGLWLLKVKYDPTLLVRYVAGLLLIFDWHWLTWFPVELNPPLWSIGCEITSYALLPLFLALLFRFNIRGWPARIPWVVVIALIFGLQLWIVRNLVPDSYRRSWDFGLVGGAKTWMPNYNPIGFFAIFALGSLAAGIQVRLASLRSGLFDLLAIAGLVLAGWSISHAYPNPDGYGAGNIPYDFPWFPIGWALILIAVPSTLYLKRVSDISPIAFIARISFGIYIWHYFLMEVARVRWDRDYVYNGMTEVWPWVWISAAAVLGSVTIATVSYYFFEAPIIRWARGLEQRSPPKLAPATA